MVETVSVAVNPTQLKHRLRHDPEFFIQFFMGAALAYPVPQFQIDIFYEMTHADVPKLVVAIPRGHHKTGLAKLAALWYMLFSDFRFVLYVSGSHDLVIPYVNDIANFFLHPNFIQVFGEIDTTYRGAKWQDGIGVYKFRIPSLDKTCILRGLGSGQRVRGINVDNERPQLAIADDIEDDEDTITEQGHRKMARWWYGPFIKCLNNFSNKVIVTGNLTAKRSLLWSFLQSPRWRSYLYGCLTKERLPLWEDLWSLEALREDFLEYQEQGMVHRWFAEMMNQPVAEGGGVVDPERISYEPMQGPENIEYGFLTVDPAISTQKWADPSVIVAHGWVNEIGKWQILETDAIKGRDPTVCFWDAIRMASYWGFRMIGVESGAMQGAIEHHWKHLKLLNHLEQYQIVPVYAGNRAKNGRIASWASQLEEALPEVTSTYCLTEGDFAVTQELVNYEPVSKDNEDNIIDACAYGPQMQEMYLYDIMSTLPDHVKGTATSLYKMAAC